jgi:TRAP-type transport system periplasmic protein
VGIRTRSLAAAVLAACVAAMVVLDAQGAVKIGTIAPDNSAYVKALREMGEAWKNRTNARVTYTVFPGTVGNEEKMLRDMRGSAQKLHAAQLSAISLGRLDSAFNVFGVPLFFESYAEADLVLDALTPLLEARLEQQRLKALNMAWAGWVHVFSKEPIRTPDDLKKQVLFTSAGDDDMTRWYSANGFKVLPLDTTQMLPALKTRQIQALPAPPLFAQLLNWYESAPYMMDLGFAPLLGATVMSLEAWNRLSAGDQHIVLDEARRAGGRLRESIPRLESEAIEAMKKKKLTVTTADPVVWRGEADKLGEAMRKVGLVDQEAYDIARRQRDAARAGR